MNVNENEIIDLIPRYSESSEPFVISDGDGAVQLISENTSADEWRGYCRKLTDAGFAPVWERTAAGNLFAAYRKGDCAVTTYLTPFNSFARTVAEPAKNMSPADSVSNAEKLCTPLLTQIGRTFSTTGVFRGVAVNCGLMCYIIRLEDGRFIVIDGGLMIDAFADGIMNTLRAQAPDPENITVAAWIITHTHCDHTGGLIRFTEKYLGCNNVKIDELILNYPGEQDCRDWIEKNEYYLRQKSIGNYFAFNPAGKLTKVHSGEVRHIGGAELEFLSTQEDFRTPTRSWADTRNWNNTSVVFRVRLAGQSIMFLADAGTIQNENLVKMYGGYLKSDICQVAHHGGAGGTVEVYSAIDPDVALFTTSDEAFPLYLTAPHNAHLVNDLHVKETINAANRITEMDIPYTPGTSRVTDNES